MFVFNIKKFLTNKLTIIFFSLFSILIILSTIVYTLAAKTTILRGTVIEDIIGKIGKGNSIFNMEDYYAEYEVIVISNKNTNTYVMKEWYKKGVGNKVEYLDSDKSKVSIVTKKDKITIKNQSQKNILIIDPYISSYTNLLSISTFLNIYNKSIKESKCFSASSYEKINNINMILDNVCKMKEKCNCELKNVVKNVSKAELKLDKNTGFPLTYIIYDNDKKVCISIVYNKFDINKSIKNNIFGI